MSRVEGWQRMRTPLPFWAAAQGRYVGTSVPRSGQLWQLEQVELLCACDRLGAAGHRQLAEEMVDMRFHRTDGNH